MKRTHLSILGTTIVSASLIAFAADEEPRGGGEG